MSGSRETAKCDRAQTDLGSVDLKVYDAEELISSLVRSDIERFGATNLFLGM